MKRCKWVIPTPQINGKYESAPCEIMRWYKNDLPVICNGWKAACLGMDLNMYDIFQIRDSENGEAEVAEE